MHHRCEYWVMGLVATYFMVGLTLSTLMMLNRAGSPPRGWDQFRPSSYNERGRKLLRVMKVWTYTLLGLPILVPVLYSALCKYV